MMKHIYIFLIAIGVLAACGKGDSGSPDPSPPVDPGVKVTASELSLPVNNEVCTAGKVVSTSESTITFSWKSAANSDSYELTIKNLESGVSTIQNTTTLTADATLKRNAPYSWFVTAKSSKSTSTAKSDTWKFYNSGPGTSSYAPFPAEIIAPLMGQAITAVSGKITLDWNGSDADNDVSAYDIYLGTTSTPALLKAAEKESILKDVTVTSGTTYYWKVITKDGKGNSSDSGIYQFKVN